MNQPQPNNHNQTNTYLCSSDRLASSASNTLFCISLHNLRLRDNSSVSATNLRWASSLENSFCVKRLPCSINCWRTAAQTRSKKQTKQQNKQHKVSTTAVVPCPPQYPSKHTYRWTIALGVRGAIPWYVCRAPRSSLRRACARTPS